MPRWAVFVPFVALVAATAVIGLSMGRKAALRSDETEVITRIADHYVETEGAGTAPTDCTARLATAEALWLVVRCAPEGRAAITYYIDRFGAVAHVERQG